MGRSDILNAIKSDATLVSTSLHAEQGLEGHPSLLQRRRRKRRRKRRSQSRASQAMKWPLKHGQNGPNGKPIFGHFDSKFRVKQANTKCCTLRCKGRLKWLPEDILASAIRALNVPSPAVLKDSAACPYKAHHMSHCFAITLCCHDWPHATLPSPVHDALFEFAVWNILVLDVIAMWLYEVCVPQCMLLQLILFDICLLNSMICG